jgi:hypothetical protein
MAIAVAASAAQSSRRARRGAALPRIGTRTNDGAAGSDAVPLHRPSRSVQASRGNSAPDGVSPWGRITESWTACPLGTPKIGHLHSDGGDAAPGTSTTRFDRELSSPVVTMHRPPARSSIFTSAARTGDMANIERRRVAASERHDILSTSCAQRQSGDGPSTAVEFVASGLDAVPRSEFCRRRREGRG